MGLGGRLCYFGKPEEALRFFGVEDYADIYDLVNDEAEKWQRAFNRARETEKTGQTARVKRRTSVNRHSPFRQFGILCRRYAELIAADRKRLLLLLLQAPLLGFLLAFVAYNKNEAGEMIVYTYGSKVNPFLFALSCAGLWLGLLNSIQEICKERTIFLRERMANLKLAPYLFSKLAVLGAFCALQSLMLLLVVRLIIGPFPANELGIPPFLGMYATTLLTTLSAMGLGLAVSGFSPNPDRAMTVAPLVLMPQVLFSGVIFKLKGNAEFISNFINCKWSINGYFVLADINRLPANEYGPGPLYDKAAYNATWANLIDAWGVLALIVAVCFVICLAALYFAPKDNR
jgi:hypothetical protein